MEFHPERALKLDFSASDLGKEYACPIAPFSGICSCGYSASSYAGDCKSKKCPAKMSLIVICATLFFHLGRNGSVFQLIAKPNKFLIIPEALGDDRTRSEKESCNEGELRAPRLLGSKATNFFVLGTGSTTGLSSCSPTALL